MCRPSPLLQTHTHTDHFWSFVMCLNIFLWCRSVSVAQEGNPGKPQTGLVTSPFPASSPSHSCTSVKPSRGSRLSPDQLRRTRLGQRRRTFSCSPQRWVSQTERSRADSATSEFGLESDSSEFPKFRLLFYKTFSSHMKHTKKNIFNLENVILLFHHYFSSRFFSVIEYLTCCLHLSPQLPVCLTSDRMTGTQNLLVPSTPPVQAPPPLQGITMANLLEPWAPVRWPIASECIAAAAAAMLIAVQTRPALCLPAETPG